MKDKYTTFYTGEELDKMVKALQEKYNFTGCDGLPYYPEPTHIILTGIEIKK